MAMLSHDRSRRTRRGSGESQPGRPESRWKWNGGFQTRAFVGCSMIHQNYFCCDLNGLNSSVALQEQAAARLGKLAKREGSLRASERAVQSKQNERGSVVRFCRTIRSTETPEPSLGAQLDASVSCAPLVQFCTSSCRF